MNISVDLALFNSTVYFVLFIMSFNLSVVLRYRIAFSVQSGMVA